MGRRPAQQTLPDLPSRRQLQQAGTGIVRPTQGTGLHRREGAERGGTGQQRHLGRPRKLPLPVLMDMAEDHPPQAAAGPQPCEQGRAIGQGDAIEQRITATRAA